MILTPTSAWLGRHEVLDKKDAALSLALEKHRQRMESSLEAWWEDSAKALKSAWNAALFHGPWGAWTSVDFFVLEGLGFDPAPWVNVQISWDTRRGRADVVRLSEACAPVLRDSLKILTPEAWPSPPGRPLTPGGILGLQQRLSEAVEELRATGVWADPRAVTREGLLDALWAKGLELRYVPGSRLRRVRPLSEAQIEEARALEKAGLQLDPQGPDASLRIPEEESTDFWISRARERGPGKGRLQRA